jgi:hypothetical protein
MFHGIEPIELCVGVPNAELWRLEVCDDSVVTEVTETIAIALKDLVEMCDCGKDGCLNWYQIIQ